MKYTHICIKPFIWYPIISDKNKIRFGHKIASDSYGESIYKIMYMAISVEHLRNQSSELLLSG